MFTAQSFSYFSQTTYWDSCASEWCGGSRPLTMCVTSHQLPLWWQLVPEAKVWFLPTWLTRGKLPWDYTKKALTKLLCDKISDQYLLASPILSTYQGIRKTSGVMPILTGLQYDMCDFWIYTTLHPSKEASQKHLSQDSQQKKRDCSSLNTAVSHQGNSEA